jgi:beta-N-acetylhexosaminidase
MRERVGRLAHEARHLSIVVLGNPYIVRELPEPHALLCTYTDGAEACRAALEVLTGGLAASGRLPVTISPSYPYGFGLEMGRRS